MGRIDNRTESLEAIRAGLVDAFARAHGPGKPRVFAAPGRVNLMGAHVDYCGGPVLPIAIDRYTLVAARPSARGELSFNSLGRGEVARYSLDELPARPTGAWHDYALGVARALLARGARATGLELLVGGNLPLGGGLSSSASLCLAVCHALEACWEFELDSRERIAVALEAEREFVGVPCGILDPFAIAFARAGQALWLETRSEQHEWLPLELSSISLAVVDSGVRRQLAATAYAERVEQCAVGFEALRLHEPAATCLADIDAKSLAQHASCLPELPRLRAEHVVGEVARTRAARAALCAGDLAELGALMTLTHASLRDLHEVSCAELDALVDTALELDGVLGGRLIGAGFGGCAAFLVERDAEPALEQALVNENRARLVSAPGLAFLRGAAAPLEL